MTMNEQMIIELRLQSEQAKAKLKEFGNNLREVQKAGSPYVNDFMRGYATQAQKVYIAQKNLNQALTEMKPRLEKVSNFMNPDVFQGWAMSLMFAGMALQRMSQSIYKFGTKAFQEISHSVEGTVTQTDMLEGSMKYLGFTIGAALEPVISFLIPIVDKISEWVEANPDLTRQAVIFTSIAGAIAMISGSAVLAWTNGLQPLINGIKSLTGLTGMQQLSIGFALYNAGSGIASLIKGEVLEGIAELTKSAGFIAAATMSNKTTAGVLFGIAFAMEAVDIVLKNGAFTKDNLARLFMSTAPGAFMVSPGVGAALLTVGVAMTILPEDTFDYISRRLAIAFGMVIATLAGVAESVLSPITAVINGIIAAYNWVTGDNIKPIDTWGWTNKAMDRINQLSQQQKMLTSGISQEALSKDYLWNGDTYTKRQSAIDRENYQAGNYITVNGLTINLNDVNNAYESVEQILLKMGQHV